MAIVNGTFTEPGELPGTAKGWSIVSRCQAERWAAFGAAPPTAYEDFERWSTRQLEFTTGQLAIAFFAPGGLGHEGFERGWANDLYQSELSPALSTAALFEGVTPETFDWLDHFRVRWPEIGSVAALFAAGSQDGEWFERGWNNSAFRFSWSLTPSASASFGGEAAETFQGAWPHAVTL